MVDRGNLFFSLSVLIVLFAIAWFALPSKGQAFAVPIAPDVFATLFIGQIGFLVLIARGLVTAETKGRIHDTRKEFNRFLRVTLVTFGATMGGLIFSAIGVSNPVLFGFLVASILATFYQLVMSLDLIFG